MAIKGNGGVDDTRRIEQIQHEVSLLRKTKKTAEDPTVVPAKDDTVDVSTAKEVRNALESEVSDPARRARIEELKKQVAEGTYEFPSTPEQIQKMLSNLDEEVQDLQDLLGE